MKKWKVPERTRPTPFSEERVVKLAQCRRSERHSGATLARWVLGSAFSLLLSCGVWAQGTLHDSLATCPLRWIVNAGSLNRSRATLPLDLQRRVFDSPCTFLIGLRPPRAYRSWRVVHTGAAQRLSQVARLAHNHNIAAILYDPEAWHMTPWDEKRHPARATCRAEALAHAQGKLLIATPAIDLIHVIEPGQARREGVYSLFVRSGLAGRIARCADVYDIQAQGSEGDPALFAEFVRKEVEQIKASNPQVIILAGLSTNPNGQRITARKLDAAVRLVKRWVNGFWLNIPAGGRYCPRCGVPRPQVALSLLKRLVRKPSHGF